jgi:hypothetical protein
MRIAIAFGLFLLATPAAAQSGVDAFNEELRAAWTRVRPAIAVRLTQEAQTQLAAVDHRSGGTEVRVERVRSVQVTIDGAPGVTRLATDGLALAVPLQGRWRLEAEADVRVRTRVLFARPTFRFPARIIIEELRLQASAALDDADATRPTIRRVDTPRVDFRLKVRSSSFFHDLLARALTPFANRLAHRAVEDALRDLAPQLAQLNGLPGPVPGESGPTYTDSGAATPFAEVVANVDRKLRDVHLPHGQIAESP